MSWKPLIVCPQPQMAQRIAASLREAGPGAPVQLTEYPRTGAIASIARQNACDICFLDVASNPEHALLLIEELSPEVPVVVLHPLPEADLILRCLRRGACEFLTDPALEAVRTLLERVQRTRTPAEPRTIGKIYCVVPGKAGCGASTVAVHLAIALTAGRGRVLLVDGDLLNGSIAFLLKLKPEFHLGDALRDWQRMDQDVWSRLTVAAHGVDVLCAPENPAAGAAVDRESASELCGFWRDRYDSVVIDTPDARVAAETGFAPLADATLLVSTNELAALQSTRRAIEYLDRSLAARSRLRLLINRYTPATGLKREDVKTALGLESYAILANDYNALQTALLNGMPAPAESRFAASMEALARQLQNRAPRAAKTGLLGRLLRPRRKAPCGN